MDSLKDSRSGDDRRKEDKTFDIERRVGIGRRLSDREHQIMLDAERIRWKADIAASFAKLKKKATEGLAATLSEIETDGQTKFEAAWARYVAGQTSARAEMETNPVGADKIFEVAKYTLEGTVQEIKDKGEKVLELKNIT